MARAGDVAGNSSDGRYVVIQIDGRSYYAHRLAWFYVHGAWPSIVDHVNRNGLDNRLSNLRAATKSLNAVNSPLAASNTSGHRGVYWSKRNGKWLAKIKVAGKEKYIGLFNDKDEAAAAYRSAAITVFGEFAP
jgi:hypothetical protein